MPGETATEDTDVLNLPEILPVLPLKDTVIFPYIIVPLSVGIEHGVAAVDQALADNRLVALVAQKDGDLDEPQPENLHAVGTVGMIMRMLKLPDGRLRILIQGVVRVRLEHTSRRDGILQARVRRIDDQPAAPHLDTEALIRSVKESLEQAVHLGRGISPEVMVIAANLEEPGRLADLVASNLDMPTASAQALLENIDPRSRLHEVLQHLTREIQLLTMQQEIVAQARDEIDRSQRDFFLRQQMKAIQDELGESDELAEEIAGYRQLAEKKGLTDEAIEELEKQIKRLERSHPDSAETSIIRTYLEWLTGLPWNTFSKDNLDLEHAKIVLDADHYNLVKVKERILELLAIRKLNPETKGPILCFVGPPGVGKTSLGRSIARALDRTFIRLSLGGVRDEAEVRGHRRTYVGALPGRILQGLHRAQHSNPVFMLDEIDKIGNDYRGDPSSALLEVLDPEQNFNFRDHYLSVSYDLSQVLFITTANLLEPIQPAFLDRMEVIRLSGYTEEEKLKIARRHLIPKQIVENGLGDFPIRFTDGGLQKIIRGYTHEAGLRNLEREIAAICRKAAVRVARGRKTRMSVDARRVQRLLGTEMHFSDELLDRDRIGVAAGLAWTAAGGDLMFIEVIAIPGEGKVRMTGQLGDVMKESAQAAVSYVQAYATQHGYDPTFFSSHDIHIHAPSGAIPKDGPSAGITIATAVLSLLSAVPVSRTVAMTGEITLRGEILSIGGLKEKALAARAAGIRTVIVPERNRRDLKDLPPAVRKALQFIPCDHMDDVIKTAMVRPLEAPSPADA